MEAPKNLGVPPILGSLVAILDFEAGAALQAVSECPFCH